MKKGAVKNPEFKLPKLIKELHHVDCWIDFNKLQRLLDYGDEAVPELENIVRKALHRRTTQDFTAPPSDMPWYTVLHALYLLAELRSERSLDLVLEFLSQKEEFLDYWLHDLLNDDIWEVVYYLGQNQIDKLEAFVLNQKVSVFARLTVCTALIQIAAHDARKAPRVSAIFKKVLALEKEDPDFIGLLASELLDLKRDELKPAILEALDRHGVWEGIISAEEVEQSYRKRSVRKLNPLDLFERYEFFRQYAYFAQTSPFKPRKATRRKLKDQS